MLVETLMLNDSKMYIHCTPPLIWKVDVSAKGKAAAIDKCTKPSTFEFLHSNLEHKNPPPHTPHPTHLGDIWVPSLPIDIGVKLFILRMESLFKARDRLIKVEHANVISRLLSWNLEIN